MKKLFLTLLTAVVALTCICAPRRERVKPAELQPEWSRNAVIYEVNLRQYTDSGTLSEFARHIPRLKALGVDILWFMPIHPISELNRKGELGSYYAVRDYKAVNPEFGTLDDFRSVVDQAHRAGMKVIIDWVPNHTGCDNVWVEAHPDWYARNDEGEMFGPYDWTDVYKLDYSNPEMRQAMRDALSFWLTEAGIDGFRCDVAGEVPTDFWDETRPVLEALRPGLFMLAESSEPSLTRKAFDMDYAWPMKDLFSEIAATSGQYRYFPEGQTEPRRFAVKHANDIDSMLKVQRTDFNPAAYHMYMTTNHDLNSWEGTEFERLGSLAKAFAVLTYTLPGGMPLIYTGQETGMNRAFEFFTKDKAPQWEPRNEYFDFYRKLNQLKHNRPELANGMFGGDYNVIPAGSDDLLLFVREGAKNRTIVGVNLGSETLTIDVDAKALPGEPTGKDYLSGQEITIPGKKMRPGEYFVILQDEK